MFSFDRAAFSVCNHKWGALSFGVATMVMTTDFIETITTYAIRAFGEDGAARWLRNSWRVFDGQRPIDMAQKSSDAERVIEYLRELLGAETSLSEAGLRPSEI